MIDDTEPDWIDLNDYIVIKHPSLYSATKYLSSMTEQRRLWLIQWRDDGSPEIPDVIT